jgi:hypothetical protein
MRACSRCWRLFMPIRAAATCRRPRQMRPLRAAPISLAASYLIAAPVRFSRWLPAKTPAAVERIAGLMLAPGSLSQQG